MGKKATFPKPPMCVISGCVLFCDNERKWTNGDLYLCGDVLTLVGSVLPQDEALLVHSRDERPLKTAWRYGEPGGLSSMDGDIDTAGPCSDRIVTVDSNFIVVFPLAPVEFNKQARERFDLSVSR
jgi:hypothetical protein